MYKDFGINENIINFVNETENSVIDYFKNIDKIYEYNQLKVLKSFQKNNISEQHFYETTGYAYNDTGRDAIEKIYADLFNTEDAIVRTQIVSGTHAIAIALYGLLNPNDKFLYITGKPYDTLNSTIGINNEEGSLKNYGINFSYIDLKNDTFDYESIKNNITKDVKLIVIQRSKGYSIRKSISIDEIKEVVKFIKSINKDINILVDNCYGEFVDCFEPTDVLVDIMCGSLIKNIGGGLAKTGGYIVGKKDLINRCENRLTAPGIGKEVGANLNQNRNILLGLFLAPQVVANALKGAKLFAKAYEKLGYEVYPKSKEYQSDIVLAIKLGNVEKLNLFCNAIQKSSPIDSFVKPILSDMPGYNSRVIMACGSFIQGASIELSCDAPEVEPYVVYLQGGLSYFQIKLALMNTIQELNLL